MGTDNTCCSPSEADASQLLDIPSAVSFDTERRPHVSVNVRSIRESLPFYKAMFNRPPNKLKDDYAKWESENPPINLTLNEHSDAEGSLGHYGIEVKSTDAVGEYHSRFRGLSVNIKASEEDVACCFAVQTKVWAADPDGNRWEIFVVTDDDADDGCESTCLCYNPESGGCEWN